MNGTALDAWENADEDDDKNSPSSAGISTVAIVGIAIGGLVLLSVIGAAVVINIQKHRPAEAERCAAARAPGRGGGCRDGRTGRAKKAPPVATGD